MVFFFAEDTDPEVVDSGSFGEVYVIDMVSSRLSRFENRDETKDDDGIGRLVELMAVNAMMILCLVCEWFCRFTEDERACLRVI